MTRGEIALQALKELVPTLREEWMKEAIDGPLDDGGDKVRRLAAVKSSVLSDIVKRLELRLREM